MENNFARPPDRPTPSDDEIRDYAYHLYQQDHCVPGHDLDHWLEATACLKANIPADQSGTRLHQYLNGLEPGELYAATLAARSLMS